jgi:hypothetical protein
MNLREIEITKEKVHNGYGYTDVYTATFWCKDTLEDIQYCGIIYPNLQSEYTEWAEGGYVVDTGYVYSWEIEDIDHINTYQLVEDDGEEIEVFGSLPNLNPEIKKGWLEQLAKYMTDKQLFID